MHPQHHKPGCYTTDEPQPNAPRFEDQGRSCGNARTPELYRHLLNTTPGCAGCTRAERAKRIYWGVVEVDDYADGEAFTNEY